MMNDNFNVNKRSAGRFLTQGDPFGYDVFSSWMSLAIKDSATICEPYAGKNGLLAFAADHVPSLIEGKTFISYDIMPCSDDENLFPASPVQKANTLLSIPQDDIDIIITNPPYLARNSARRQGLDFPFEHIGTGIKKPQDLYQICMDTCLATAPWVCMLIPESFITSKYDKSRLMHVISLPGDLFNDTDMPVCLALFGPATTDDYDLYAPDGTKIASAKELSERNAKLLDISSDNTIKFNRKDGHIGLRGLDDTSASSIRFCDRDEIPSDRIKESSRGLTRIFIPYLEENEQKTDKLIKITNRILSEWREQTSDIFLTAFKGVRKDGRYRRRLSYDIANKILCKSIRELEEASSKSD